MLKTIGRLWLFVIAILAVPLVSMQFTDEVVWTLGDFVLAGLLLFVLGITMHHIWSQVSLSTVKKWLVLCLVLGVFLLIWAELAVGLLR